MKIINETKLSYKDIGSIIDQVMKENKGTTHYIGQVEICTVKIHFIKVGVQIRYLKKYCEWKFVEMEK